MTDAVDELRGTTPLTDAIGITGKGTLGERLRVFLRFGTLVVWTAGWYLVLWVGLIVSRKSARRRTRGWIVRHWAVGIGKILGMNLEVRGPVPRPPFFLVANHLSYMDIFALYSTLDCVFIAKTEMDAWPVVGFLCRSVDTIFVNRESKRDSLRALNLISRAIDEGDGVVLFPEGTTSVGAEVAPLKPALLHWAARETQPVHYAAMTYATDDPHRPAHRSVCWWGDMALLPHVAELCRMRRFRAILTFGPTPLSDSDRGALASRLHAAIASHFIPVVSREVVCL